MKNSLTNILHTINKPIKQINNEFYPKITLSNNLRFVEPYEYQFEVKAKNRWIGNKLQDVLLNEFKQYTYEDFLLAILCEKIKVNNIIVNKDYIIKDKDVLTVNVLRKENPIVYKKLNFIFENDDFIVINKPSSWPVHSSGGYNYNTLIRILEDEYSKKNLKILHRLDKHTSGVIVMAKTMPGQKLFNRELHFHKIEKTYLCRVKGNFLHEKINVKRSITCINESKGIYTDCDNDDVLPLKEHNIEEKVYKQKSAETDFEKIFYDIESNTSVIYAKPVTGRTHQIRVHLMYLGYPIANDPCYGGVFYNGFENFQNKNIFQQCILREENLNFSGMNI